MNTIQQATNFIRARLVGLYPATEIDGFIRIIFGHFFGMTPLQIHLYPEKELPPAFEANVRQITEELGKYRPIQYILGETGFYGLDFEVTPDVLIPRPETEELVDWMIHEYDMNAGLNIVDIGTGSGCIAIALAVNFPNAKVWAVDKSGSALTVARRNARRNGVEIHYIQDDILSVCTLGFDYGSLDVIVSNPPYIAQSEKQQMRPNVLEYEPPGALFPPGSDPLIFYRCISVFGSKCLKHGGGIFFEINEAFPGEVTDILKQDGFSDITLRKDINGKWRMVSACKS